MRQTTSRMAAVAVIALSLSAPNALAPNAMAADEPKESPGDLALEGLTTLMKALETFVDSIPQYEAPEILPNGDIIIRRKGNPDPPKGKSDEDSTEL